MYRPWTTLMVQMFQEGPDNIKGKARIVNILGAGLSQEEVDLLNHVMSEQKNGVELLNLLLSRGFEPFQVVPEAGDDENGERVVLHVWMLKRPDRIGLERVVAEESDERAVRSCDDERPGE